LVNGVKILDHNDKKLRKTMTWCSNMIIIVYYKLKSMKHKLAESNLKDYIKQV